MSQVKASYLIIGNKGTYSFQDVKVLSTKQTLFRFSNQQLGCSTVLSSTNDASTT